MPWPNPHGSARLTGLALGAILSFVVGQIASAAPITASYLSSGVQAPNFTSICGTATSCNYGTESFTSWNGGAFSSSFNTGSTNFTGTTFINGSYTAGGDTNWTKSAANQYGGINGTAPYPEIMGNSTNGDAYAVSFTRSANIPGINYFGIWISALDAGNALSFYNNGQLVYTFGASDLVAALGSCNGTTNAYCGNPTTPFSKQNAGELYAYVNFFDQVGFFDEVILDETGSGGFESSNHAVAYINPLTVTGTTFAAPDRPLGPAFTAKTANLVVTISEPSTLLVTCTALFAVLAVRRRQFAGQHVRRRSALRQRTGPRLSTIVATPIVTTWQRAT